MFIENSRTPVFKKSLRDLLDDTFAPQFNNQTQVTGAQNKTNYKVEEQNPKLLLKEKIEAPIKDQFKE